MLITIYLIRYVLCALAFGTLVVRCNVFSCMSKRTGFLLGFSAAPFCIATIMYITCLIIPGISSKLLIVFPMLVSILYLLMGKSRETLKSLTKAAAAGIKRMGSFAVEHKVCVLVPVILAAFFSILLLLANRNIVVRAAIKVLALKEYASYAIIAVVLAVLIFCILAYFLQKKRFNQFRFDEKLLVKMALGTGFLLIMIITAFRIYYASQISVRGSDPSHYFTQAKYFAESRDAGEIDHYTGEKEGTVFQDDHGYLWPVWLGDGRFFVTEQEDSLNPVIDKVTICIVFVSFLLALSVIVWEFTGSGLLAGFSISLIYLYRFTEYLILEGSRDAFRFLGMLLLLTVCVNGIMTAYRRKGGRKDMQKKLQGQDVVEILFTGLFAFFCIEGHEGNIYLMLGLFIVYGVVLLCYKVSFLKLCFLGLSGGIGTILGITKAIGNLLTSGSLASSTAVVFHDTKVVESLQKISDARSDWGEIAQTYHVPELLLIFFGILSMLFLIVEGIRRRRDGGNIKTLSIAACLFGLLLPMLGVFNFLGYNFSKWTIEQTRYRMYFMVLLSIAVCYAGCLLWKKRQSVVARYCILYFVILATGLAPLSQGGGGPITDRDVMSLNNEVEVYIFAGDAAKEKAQRREVYVDDQILAYYCDCDAKLLYHPIAEPLIQAETKDEIEKALKELNIGVIVLDIENMYHDYSLLPMWDYINDPQYVDAFTAQMETGKKWMLYQIKK